VISFYFDGYIGENGNLLWKKVDNLVELIYNCILRVYVNKLLDIYNHYEINNCLLGGFTSFD